MSSWTNSPADPAGKIQVNRFNNLWRKLSAEHNTVRELWGTIGQSESESCIWSPFGHNTRAEVAAVQTKLGEAYNWQLTAKNAAAVIRAIESELPALEASRPVRDRRRSAEEVAVERAAAEVRKQEQEQKQAEERRRWVELWGDPERPDYEAPSGAKVLTVRLFFNDSDAQSDYFNNHAPLSPAFGVYQVPVNSPETERLARRAVAALPESISSLVSSWEWNVERYSMGHGNYLQSEPFEFSPALLEAVGYREYYGQGGQVRSGHLEIQFGASRCCLRLGNLRAVAEESADPVEVASGAVTVSLNSAKQGVEVRFASRPEESVLDQLKSAGFRWSRFSRCWYKTQSAESIAFARRLAGEEVDIDKLREAEEFRCAGAYADQVCNSNFERPSAGEW